MIRYDKPRSWVRYDRLDLIDELTQAKAQVLALGSLPYQRRWVEELQEIQLKREVAGTSRIEGAEFTERELDIALRDSVEGMTTRSQRQAHAAMVAYRWLAELPLDYPVDGKLICEVHRRIVRGADDDHCPPGQLRGRDENVIFGSPKHRGVEGGTECEAAFEELSRALQGEFRDHDLLIQALALHYHLGAMHPFLDGNGRTARAMEAVMLQRAGLRDILIATSNYYYDEKTAYLGALSEARAGHHDLTPFLRFGLRGIALQCQRLVREIGGEIKKALFRDLMYGLFNRLRTTKKRVIAERQVEILKILLVEEAIDWQDLLLRLEPAYRRLKTPRKAMVRDVSYLQQMRALRVIRPQGKILLEINLDWPTQITEEGFFRFFEKLPHAKSSSFLP